MLWIITLIATLILYWIYDGYGRFLQVLCLLAGKETRLAAVGTHVVSAETSHVWPSITVLLTVHNESAVIHRRIQNLLACDYPQDRFEILIASDGSTDATNSIVAAIPDSRVRLYESPGLGKTGTQNAAIRSIFSDIIVFTDADILFEPAWLKRVAMRFGNAAVGAVDGRAIYRGSPSDAIQVNQGYYWNYELKLRWLESQLGILAVVAGACFAVRRNLFVTMDPAIGEDCIVPLDIVSQGFRVVHEPLAVAWFESEEDSSITLRRRIRMTLRNWQGTWTRPSLLNPLHHPGYSFALWSHKLLRWMSPLFLAMATVSSLCQFVWQPTVASCLMFTPYAMIFGLAAIGWRLTASKMQVPGAGAAYSFVLANTAFLIGIWRAMTGHRIHSYRNA